MELDWDPAKSERNLRERGFGFDYAARIFAGRILLQLDARKDYGEERVKAAGAIDGTVFAVIFTDRGEVRWIISARRAGRRERQVYASAEP